jgi:hypothetical protein
LNSLRVYQVRSIKLKRYVLDDGSRVYGQEDKGTVLFGEASSTETGLYIYRQRGLEVLDFLVPLTEEFGEFLGLGQSSRELLSKVITTEKSEQYLESLERAGISGIFDSENMEMEPLSETIFHGETSTNYNADGSTDEDVEAISGRLQIGETQVLAIQEPNPGHPSSSPRLNLPPSPRAATVVLQKRDESAASLEDNFSPSFSKERRTPRPTSHGRSMASRSSGTWTPVPDRAEAENLVERMSHASIVDTTPEGGKLHATLGQGSQQNSTASTFTAFSGSGAFPSSKLEPVSLRDQWDAKICGGFANLGSLSPPSRNLLRASGSRRASHGGFSVVSETGEGDTPHEIGFQGEYLVSIIPLTNSLRKHH